MIDMPVQFDRDTAQAAADEWGFNCGPGALCAVLNMTPADVRLIMGNFEKKGYTNPTLMYAALQKAGVKHETTYRGDKLFIFPPVNFGLVRVQWGGPWTEPGVRFAARYRYTHWVAMRNQSHRQKVFDINAICQGGWISFREWEGELMPWLAEQTVPKWNGEIWPTHVIEINHDGGTKHA